MTTLFDDATAHARSDDPETSHAAAASVKNLTTNQAAIKTILRSTGRRQLRDDEIVELYQLRYRELNLPRQSESGIRSRRAELARRGDLVEGEKSRMPTGRMARTWTLKEH